MSKQQAKIYVAKVRISSHGYVIVNWEREGGEAIKLFLLREWWYSIKVGVFDL